MKLLKIVSAIAVAVVVFFISYSYSTPQEAEMLGGGSGTINQLEQWKKSGGYITQNVSGAILKLTGYESNGNCLVTDINGVVSTTTCGTGSGTADGVSNWLYNGSRLSPSTTVGIGVFASSTIGNGTGAGGLTVNGGATTTGNAYFGGGVAMQGWALSTSTVVCMAPEQCQYQADGTEDDVTIQAAIDYVSSVGGGEVVIKAKQLIISSAVYMASNTSLRGISASTTLRAANGLNDSMIKTYGVSTTTNIAITNLAMDGTLLGQVGGPFGAIYLNKVDNADVSATNIYNTDFAVGVTGDSRFLRITNNYFHDIHVDCVFANGMQFSVINNNTFSKCFQEGIDFNGDGTPGQTDKNVVVNGNSFYYAGTQTSENHGNIVDIGGPAEYITISNNNSIGGHIAIFVKVNSNHVNITNNTLSNLTGTAILINSSYNYTVVGNKIITGSVAGITVVGDGRGVISNNFVQDIDGPGIRLTDGTEHFVVSNNFLYGNSPGIRVANATKGIIEGNYFYNNSVEGIELSTTTNVSILNNSIVSDNGAMNYGMEIDANSGYIFENGNTYTGHVIAAVLSSATSSNYLNRITDSGILGVVGNYNIGGRLGIGTTTPADMLSVVGTAGVNPLTISSSTGTSLLGLNQYGRMSLATTSTLGRFNLSDLDATGGAAIQVNAGTNAGLHILATNANLNIERSGTNRNSQIRFRTAAVDRWFVGQPDSDNAGSGTEFFIGETAGGGSARFWIESGGFVGINTTVPSTTLHVVGTTTSSNLILSGLSTNTSGNAVCIVGTTVVTAGGTTCVTSSGRFKEDIEPLTKWKDILDIEVVSYNYKSQYADNVRDAGGKRLGFIAEQVETVDPQLVQYDSEGNPLSVHFDGITAKTVLAIQEMKKEIDGMPGKAQKSAQDNWQWIMIAILFFIVGAQQYQLNNLKREKRIR